MRLVVLLAVLGCACRHVEPPEPTVYDQTFFVDPDSGDDGHDGLTEATAFKSLRPFDTLHVFSKQPNTKVALKRGTVLRLTETVQLHGSDTGWVAWSTWGDPSAPKPLVLGSVELSPSSWSAPDADGVRTFDWSPYLDGNGGRSLTGVEQGPGNLWFFERADGSAAMAAMGFRTQADVGPHSRKGDWYYDPAARTLRLFWPDATAPAETEAAVNRIMVDPSGQKHVIVEDWDLRYGGNYAIKGGTFEHLRVRRVDMSFIGGGTKSQQDGKDQYVRAGNGFEVFGDGTDVVVEDCRVHQAFDSGMDPQHTGSTPVTVTGLVFRNNLISYVGLAGVELWERPGGSTLSQVVVEHNTIVSAGRGWGFAQHDFVGSVQLGAGLAMFAAQGTASNVVVQHNVFARARVAVMAEFLTAEDRAFFRAFSLKENLWSLGDGLGAVLFEGTPGQVVPDLSTSPTFKDLASWQANPAAPGVDQGSVEGDPEFDAVSEPVTEDRDWLEGLPPGDAARPTRLGPFALHGDYRRTRATRGQGFGASLAP
jgi:hypothetical protein